MKQNKYWAVWWYVACKQTAHIAYDYVCIAAT